MTSDIDPTVFPDYRKVKKRDLREQFSIAKAEIEALQRDVSPVRHTAFDVDLDENAAGSGTGSSSATLYASTAEAFGAAGNASRNDSSGTDDTAALQAMCNFYAGTNTLCTGGGKIYRITAPLLNWPRKAADFKI